MASFAKLRSFSRISAPASLADFQRPLLAACSVRPLPAAEPSTLQWPSTLKDWSSLQSQAEAAASWPHHPLGDSERLALASSLVSRATDVLGSAQPAAQNLCDFYEGLLVPDAALAPKPVSVANTALVAVTSAMALEAAIRSAVLLLLGGHAVTLAAASGPLRTLQDVVAGFPPELLQAAEIGSLATLPASVRALRCLGPGPKELWSERAPPGDFGGLGSAGRHGAMLCAEALSLATVSEAERPIAPVAWSDEALALAKLPGGVGEDTGEMEKFLELLWDFRAPLQASPDEAIALAPSHKHILLTFCGSVLPQDLVKAAMISAMSPFHERITLHAVGLGSRGLAREPLKTFCDHVCSGRSGLAWEVVEHADWAAFLDWLSQASAPVHLFSTLRNVESEVKRCCAATGGAAWVQMWPGLTEQLRRWTTVVRADADERRLRNQEPPFALIESFGSLGKLL